MQLTMEHPEYLLFLGLIPLLVAVHFYSLHFARQKAMRFANFEALEKIVQGSSVIPKNYLLLVMRVLTLAFFTLAASGLVTHYETLSLAYDYVLAVDTSSSMLASDFYPDRMTAVRDAAYTWLGQVPASSHIGVVEFSTLAAVDLAPTDDLAKVRAAIAKISPERSGGTAVCEAIKASSNQLLVSNRPKAILLLSDGQNNVGCSLDEGVAYAKKNNITIFSIGVSSEKGGTVEGMQDVYFKLDEAALKGAAEATGGKYVRAKDGPGLDSAFSSLQKTAMMTEALPLTVPLMVMAFLMVFVDWSLSITRYRSIP